MAQTLPFVIFILASGAYILFKTDFRPEETVTGKNVVVTGASTGIGEQLAYEYAKYKANILITARREKELQQVAEKCKQLGAPRVEIVVADMSKSEDRARLVKQIEKHFGNELDYLILNHALFPMKLWNGNKENMTFLNYSLETNFVSYVDVASQTLPLLQANKGHIGVVSAGCAKFGCPRLSSYSATKAALHGFFSSWRQEVQFQDIPVSITLCVLGLIDTEAAMSQASDMQTPVSIDKIAGSAADTANAIVQSVAARQYEMYYPFFVSLVTKIHHLFTQTIEDFSGSHFLSALKK